MDGALLQELYTRDGSGTLISRDLYDGIRAAQVEDIGAILDLIAPLIKGGNLVDRSRDDIEKDIGTYYVYSRDDLVVACGQVKMYQGEKGEVMAEIAGLVVHPDYQRKGRGDTMLGYLERLCIDSGCHKVFILSTISAQFFIDRKFKLGKFEDLPVGKRANVDQGRGSKVYVKEIKDVRELEVEELMWDDR